MAQKEHDPVVSPLLTAHEADLTAHASLFTSTRRPYGLAVGKGTCTVPVGLHTHASAGNVSNGTDTAANFEEFIPLTDPTVGTILPVFGNWQGVSDILTGLVDLPIACAVKCSDGTILPFTFNGAHTGTIKTGGMLIPDAPLAFGAQITKTLVTGDVCSGVWIRIFVGPITAGGKWPLQNDGRLLTGGSGELALSGASGLSQTDLTLAGAGALTGGSNGNAFAPILVLGNPKGARKPIVAVVGDSQVEGANDLPLTYGFVERALLALGYPMVKVAKGNETANNFAAVAGRKYRMAVLDGCTHAICNYGTNDFVSNGRTVAQVQADNLTIATYLAALGIQVYQTTVTPRTTSTDSWATTVNQTAGTGATTDPVRLAGYNGWLRDGAPIDATSKAAVAIGTNTNVLRAGAGHPMAGYIDVNASVDSGVDTGLWKPNYTNDGTHPHGSGLTDLAAAVRTAIGGWSV